MEVPVSTSLLLLVTLEVKTKSNISKNKLYIDEKGH